MRTYPGRPSPLLAALAAGGPRTAPMLAVDYPPPVPGRPDAATAPLRAVHALTTTELPRVSVRPPTRQLPAARLVTLEMSQVIR